MIDRIIMNMIMIVELSFSTIISIEISKTSIQYILSENNQKLTYKNAFPIHVVVHDTSKPASHCPTDRRIGGSDGKSDEKSGSGRTCVGWK